MTSPSTRVDAAPRRIWWADPLRLCAIERPGGGGAAHRPERAERELTWLSAKGVRTVISTFADRADAGAYRRAGLTCHRIPVACAPEGAHVLEEIVALACRALAGGGVAIHGDRWTDFAVAVGAACLRRERGLDTRLALQRAAAAGMDVTPEARILLGMCGADRPAADHRQTVAVAAPVELSA